MDTVFTTVETDIKMYVGRIDPPTAKTVLEERNTGNRKITEAAVQEIVSDIREGRWMLNGEPIIIDKNGVLVNGQHTLTAVCRTQHTLIKAVVEGVEPEAFKTLDGGRKRKGSDVLGILGIDAPKKVHAATNVVEKYRRGLLFSQRCSAIRASAAPETVAQFPGIEEACRLPIPQGAAKLLPHSQCHGFYYLFSHVDREAADRFFEDLFVGAGLEKGDPVLLLRNRLLQNASDKGKLTPAYKAALTVKAWNLRKEGRATFVLRWSEGEPPPKIHGLMHEDYGASATPKPPNNSHAFKVV